MALTSDQIWDFIDTDTRDPGVVLAISETLLRVTFRAPSAWLAGFIPLLVEHMVPLYNEILHILLFKNSSAASIAQGLFAHEVVLHDEMWVTAYLDATRTLVPPGVIPIEQSDRDRLIHTLIDEAVRQYSDAPLKDTRRLLEAILENCRSQGQPEFIQYAFTSSFNSDKRPIIERIFTIYYNESNLIDLLLNGCIDSFEPRRFEYFNDRLTSIGVVPVAGAYRIKLDGTRLTNADAAAIADLQKDAAYSLNPTNLALVLQPANLSAMPALIPYLDPIRDAITNLDATSPFPAALVGVPGHYLEQVADVAGKTLGEKAAEVGNVAVMNALIEARISVSAKPLMQIALTNEHYNVAQALWNADHTYPDPWFPPGFIVNDAKLAQDTSAPYFFPWTDQFRNTFYDKYAIFNPGSASGVGRSTVGRALGIKPAYAPLPATGQNDVADRVVSMLNSMPDFTPGSTKDTLNLLTLSSIRDELERVTDPAIWNSKGLLPLIAKKGAVADGTVLPKADLLQVGIKLGADPNQVDVVGKAALHYVAALTVRKEAARLTTPRSIFMLKTLLAAPNVDVNLLDAAGNTPLHLMLAHNPPSVELVTLISRSKDLNYNLVNAAGDTPINTFIREPGVAPINQNDDILQILLPKVDMTIKDAAGHTPLWNAIHFVNDQAYLMKNLAGFAKGLTDRTAEKAEALSRRFTNLEAAIDTIATTSIPPAIVPDWVPDTIKTILNDDSLDLTIRQNMEKHIAAIDGFVTGAPSESDGIMADVNDSSFWKMLRSGSMYPIPVLSSIPLVGAIAKYPYPNPANEPASFKVHFNDNTSYDLKTPYMDAYRRLPTTIYNPNGTPTLAAGSTPADTAAAARNNDVLVKLVGAQYITPSHQSVLKKILQELYHSQSNPTLGNDPLTALIHLLMKFASLEKYHAIAQVKNKQAALAKVGSSLTTFITNLRTGMGLRFPTSVPIAMPFPAIQFTGRSTHGVYFTAAAAAVGGFFPIAIGLRAPVVVPRTRGGLRALVPLAPVGGGGAPPPSASLQNIFTGDTVDPAIVATDFPADVTLGPDDALSYAPASAIIPVPPLRVVSGFAVSKSNLFYKFLQPFGLTAIFSGQAYILRPAELFLALFHQTALQVAAVMRDRNHPFVVLLREVCLPAAIGLARAKGQASIVTQLNVLRGKLP